MSLTYEFSWINVPTMSYDKLNLMISNAANVANATNTVINLNEISPEKDDIQKICGQIPLQKQENGLTLSDIFQRKFDIVTLTDEDKIKSNITQLYEKVTDKFNTSNFTTANKYYLDELLKTTNTEGEKLKYINLAKFRHSVRKYLVVAYINIVISKATQCKNNAKITNANNKQDEINLLKGLLYDTTKLLLNIDAIPFELGATLVKKPTTNVSGYVKENSSINANLSMLTSTKSIIVQPNVNGSVGTRLVELELKPNVSGRDGKRRVIPELKPNVNGSVIKRLVVPEPELKPNVNGSVIKRPVVPVPELKPNVNVGEKPVEKVKNTISNNKLVFRKIPNSFTRKPQFQQLKPLGPSSYINAKTLENIERHIKPRLK